MEKKFQIKSSLYSPYYAEACNELRGPSPRLSAWATQLRKNVATMTIEPQTYRTDSMRLATELTAGEKKFAINKTTEQQVKTFSVINERNTTRNDNCKTVLICYAIT